MPEWDVRWRHEYTAEVVNYGTTRRRRVPEQEIRQDLELDDDVVITEDHVREWANLERVQETQRDQVNNWDQDTTDTGDTNTEVDEIYRVEPPTPAPPPTERTGTWNATANTVQYFDMGANPAINTNPAWAEQLRQQAQAQAQAAVPTQLPPDQRLWGGRTDTMISRTHPTHCECRPCIVNREYKGERLRPSKRTKGITTVGVLMGRQKAAPRPTTEEPCGECGEVQCTCD